MNSFRGDMLTATIQPAFLLPTFDGLFIDKIDKFDHMVKPSDDGKVKLIVGGISLPYYALNFAYVCAVEKIVRQRTSSLDCINSTRQKRYLG